MLIRWGIGLAIAAAIVAALALVRLARRRRRALRELERGFEAIASGRPPRPVTADVGGRLAGLARSFNELAPRLEARLATLEGDRQLLGAVLGGMAEGVIAIDARRRLLFANASADRLFGLGAGSVGRMVPELIRSPQVQEAVEATLAGAGPHRGEIVAAEPRGLRSGSGARVLAVHGTPLPGSPPPGAVLVFHDVTELRRLERMRQDFVANASHELKTPLASIKAYTETLLDWALHDENVNVRFLERIDEQADRLNQLILDLLSLARLESGQEVYQHGPLRAGAGRPHVRRGPPRPRRGRGAGLSLDLGPLDDATLVTADEEAVRQILDNLIDNAIKYTPEGGRVRVACRLDARRRRPWRSPTPASASPATTCPASSSGSTASTRPGAASWAGPGWASRSSSTWSSRSAARSRSRAAWGRGAPSACRCP